MASMTDYMQKVLQESAEVVAEPEKSEEELSAAILESYLSMSAAFATIEKHEILVVNIKFFITMFIRISNV